MKLITQKKMIEHMKLLGFNNISRKEFKKVDEFEVIEIHLWRTKPTCNGFCLYFKRFK